jgi:hypothetical protein
MGMHVDLLQELPAQEGVNLGPEPGALGCCALGSFTTCLTCTFTCNKSF